MRFIFSIGITILSIVAIVFFGVPQYRGLQTVLAQKAENESVLANVRKLDETRNMLRKKYDSITGEQLERLNKFLPNSPENVPLILELNGLAEQFDMVLQNVKIEDLTKDSTTRDASVKKTTNDLGPQIGVLQINFIIVGTYANLAEFVRNAEKNLRVIDFQKITFSATDDKQVYQYTVSLKTYWLK